MQGETGTSTVVLLTSRNLRRQAFESGSKCYMSLYNGQLFVNCDITVQKEHSVVPKFTVWHMLYVPRVVGTEQ